MTGDTVPRELERRLAWAIGLALAAYYGLLLGGRHYSIDGIVMFEAAKRLLFHGSLVFDPPAHWGRLVFGGHPYGIGLSIAYLPALGSIWLLAPSMPGLTDVPFDDLTRAHTDNVVYALASWTNPVITAVTGVLVFRLARSLALSPGWSVAAALAFGIASPAAVYARYDFAQPLAGLGLTACLLLLRREPSPRGLLAAGACFGAMILARSEFPILAPWLVGCTIWRRGRWRDGAILAAPVALAVGCNLLVNWLKFGDALETGVPIALRFYHPFVLTLRGVAGLLVGPNTGLLVFFPLGPLALLGLGRLAGRDRSTAVLWAGILVLTVAFYGSYRAWHGGWSWGPRFLLPLLGPLSVAAAVWAATAGRISIPMRRGLFTVLAALGAMLTWSVVLVDFSIVYAWFDQHRPVERAILKFRLEASPLVSSWQFVGTNAPDLFWIAQWSAGGRRSQIATLVVTISAALLAWSAVRIRGLLADARARSPARGERC